jgi:flagellar biosynthetic protein FliR
MVMGYIETYGLVFVFVLMRVLAVVMVLPLWSGDLPGEFRITAAVWLSVVFSFVVSPASLPEYTNVQRLLMGAVLEFGTGALIGFFMRAVLAAVALGGQLAGFQMGLAIANVIDPATSARYSMVAQWMNLLALFVFLEMDGHLMALRVVAKSFEWIPPFAAHFHASIFYGVVLEGGREMFRLAFELAWPISLTLLMVYLSLGLLARAAPQINMLMVGFPITISMGLMMFALTASSFTSHMERVFLDEFRTVERIIAALRI